MRCAAHTRCGARFERTTGTLLAVCMLMAGLASGAGLACGAGDGPGKQDDTENERVSVEAITITPRSFEVEVALTGQLEAEHEVIVRSELEGVIRSIEFAEGQRVAKDDVLFILRDGEQQARLHQAEAQERLARDVYDRTRTLTSRDISSLARKAEATAALDEARAQVELARLMVDRTRIVAPFDGVMANLLVGPGEWVKPETRLVAIAAIEKLQLHFLLPEPSIRLAEVGGIVHVRVVAYPDERFPGEVFFVSPSVDRATRRLLAKAWVPNSDHRLKPGMFANVDVVVLEKDDAMLAPESAMVYDRHGNYVWRLDAEDRAEKIPVTIGVRRHGQVEIVDGIEPGDRIVSAGISKVMAGNLLDVRPVVAHPGSVDGSGIETGATSVREIGQPDGSQKSEPGAEG
jgi:membrane fusion protein (multidrug efflux system)